MSRIYRFLARADCSGVFMISLSLLSELENLYRVFQNVSHVFETFLDQMSAYAFGFANEILENSRKINLKNASKNVSKT